MRVIIHDNNDLFSFDSKFLREFALFYKIRIDKIEIQTVSVQIKREN